MRFHSRGFGRRAPFTAAERECAAWYTEEAARRELDVEVDVSSLQYELRQPPDEEKTAAAELVRALAQAAGSTRERHQAAALALLAMDSTARTGGTAAR